MSSTNTTKITAEGKAEMINDRSLLLGFNLALNYKKNPLCIVRGEGQYLYDETGAAYLDCVNNVCHVGHCNPAVADAGSAQFHELVTNSRYLHPTIIEASKMLTDTLPDPLRVVFWVNSGSEANDLAMRLARAHTKRRGVICVGGAYHGHVTSIIDISPYKFDHVGGSGKRSWVRQAAIPDVYAGVHRGSIDDEAMGAAYTGEVQSQIDSLLASEQREKKARARRAAAKAEREALLKEGKALTAEQQEEAEADEDDDHDDRDGLTNGPGAFIMESILSCAGQVVPPKGYLRNTYAAVRKVGGICIADEVQVGFGRVGSHFWAFQLQGEDIVPDIVTMGKPMGNGFPVAAVVTTAAIAASFNNGMEYFNTYGGNPLAATVSLNVLKQIKELKLQERALQTGAVLIEGFKKLAARHPLIGSVRGTGMMAGLEIIRPTTEGSGAVAATSQDRPWSEAAYAIVYAMRARRVLLSVDGMDENVIKLKPPMVFGQADAEHVVRLLGDVLDALPQTLETYKELSASYAAKEAVVEAERTEAAMLAQKKMNMGVLGHGTTSSTNMMTSH